MRNSSLMNVLDCYLENISTELDMCDLPCKFSAKYKRKRKQLINEYIKAYEFNSDSAQDSENYVNRHRLKIPFAVAFAIIVLCGAGITAEYVFRFEYPSIAEASDELGVSLIDYQNFEWKEAYLSESGNVRILQSGIIPVPKLQDGGKTVSSNNTATEMGIQVQSITAILYSPLATDGERKDAFEMLLSPNIPVIETFYCNSLDRELKFYCGSYETEVSTAYTAVAVLEEDNQIFMISLKNIGGISESGLSEKIKEICEEMRWTNYSN